MAATSYNASSALSTSPLPPLLLLSTSLAASFYLYHSRSSPTSKPSPTADLEADPAAFYPRLRARKLALVGVLLLLEAETLFRLTWDAGRGQGGWVMLENGAMAGFWGIALLLATLSLPLSNSTSHIDRHWSYTVTLTVLTLASLTSTVLRIILPSSTTALHSPSPLLSTLLSALSLLLQLLAFLLAGSTRRCAPLIHPTSSRPVSALTSCSPVSYILFSWISPVLEVGAKVESLAETDLPVLGANDRAENLWERIQEPSKPGPKWVNKLLWRVLVVNRRLFYWQSVLALVTSFLYYLPAFFLQKFVAFLEHSPKRAPGDDAPRSLAWGYAFCLGLLVAALLDAVVGGQLWFVSNSMLATRLRTQLNCLIFDKTLKRKDIAGVAAAQKPPSDAGTPQEEEAKIAQSTGMFDFGKPDENFGSKSQVLNLFTIDVDRVADFSVWCFSIIDAPAEIIIGTFFLYKLLGYAAFVGIGVAVLFLPLNHWTSKAFASVQDRLMNARDKRVSLMNEVLQSVRMIKYMAFETPFEERILVSRGEELKHLRHNFLLEVSFNAIWSASPILCVLVSFYVFTKVMGQELTPSVAFASLAVWNELRFALNIIPDILVQAIQCLVSLRRIEKYLDSDEVSPVTLEDSPLVDVSTQEVAFRSATVTWPANVDVRKTPAAGTATPANQFELQDISVDFPVGKISLVEGSLGSGKTLLLLALLGEADVLAGQVVCPHSSPDAISLPNIEWDRLLNDENWIQPSRTAFVPQSAWLQNASIRDNILFGLPYRHERYRATLEACSLVTDLEILEDGDETEIGEKGINLSGGQKARVSLARAVYSRASLLLLDDVLSAVDAHTAQHIFNECLKGPLMKQRTIVLVSHHVQLCAPGVDYVVSLENGRIKFEGTSATFLASPRFKVADEEEEPVEAIVVKNLTTPKNKALDLVAAEAPSEASSASEAESESESESEEEEEMEKPARKLVEDETRAVGRVGWAVWKLYLGLCGGVFFWIVFVVAFGGTKLADVATTFWLNIWAGSYDAADDGRVVRSVNYYLGVYALLSLLSVIVGTLQWFILYAGSIRASDRLHRLILHSILRAPLRFFDSQPLGRLLNRFSKDLEGIDAALPDHFGRTLMYGISLLTTLAVVASVAPTFLIGFAILSIGYIHHARLFSQTARELRRLDSVSKSPLYSIYGEAIAGVAVIRAFGSSQRFMSLMLDRCSTNVTFYWYLWSVNRWLSIRFALLSAVVVALTGYVLLTAGNKIDAALAGFALTFSLNVANDILFLVRRYTALELAMVAVERIKEYAEVEQEGAEIVEPRPATHWPHAGEIHVENLSIRYAPELPDVLHELTFSIAPSQKVGIVGPTGCGKSTLALSFFRFVEAWSGQIVIDGIDIASVGLKDLRTKLTIIPQDPTILSGTLRSTLDIFNEYTDMEIFDALRRVHLIRAENDPGNPDAADGANRSPFYNLDGEVSEGGGNFSQGQRQLLCMARALLKLNRVLLLDEATASVDYETDEMISATIRQEFSESTLLVIAHRLRTVIDFDKILLLDAGKIVEYDSPSALLANPASRFYALCRASGKSEFRILKKMADGKKKATTKPRKLVRRTTSYKVPKTSASYKD